MAALELPPGLLERTWEYLQRGDVLLRLGLCALTILGLWLVTASWSVPVMALLSSSMTSRITAGGLPGGERGRESLDWAGTATPEPTRRRRPPG